MPNLVAHAKEREKNEVEPSQNKCRKAVIKRPK